MIQDDIMIDALIGQVKRWEIDSADMKEQKLKEQNKTKLKEINKKITELDFKISEHNSRIFSLKANSD
jgi:hypothetical protein